MDDVYYKIYQTSRPNGTLIVVCLQDFDEDDYHQDRFFTDDDGCQLRFNTEEEAETWLNENIKHDLIDPEYRRFKINRDFYLKQ